MRYSNSSQVQLLPINSNSGGGGGAGGGGGVTGYQAPEKADPTYGGDLEMQQHVTHSPQLAKSDRTSTMTFNRQLTGKRYSTSPSPLCPCVFHI